ncbi:sensor histidine kinase [Sediminibacillus halophilus]|uniref:histidine kinase n=1 Tax=Sediminibacillus halophilus TaxID=482461 RepID=A0A1G9R6Z9_9BACI|nr:HAMP domain-containing sensor histidine kinase [Sediminibacillus halophilus]SDM19003.1 Signal transduction histidine kinase [Sediminibacillus halophilus]
MAEYKNNTIPGLIGIFLLTYGLFFPSLSAEWVSFIIDRLQESMDIMDSGQLLIASFAYISRNGFLYFLIYFSTLLIVSALAKTDSTAFSFLYIGATITVVFLTNQFYGESSSYAPHFLSLGLLLTLNTYITKQRYYYLTFAVILFFLITAMQCLNLIPLLSQWSFGADDLAVSLKTADSFITEDQLFTALYFVLFAIFFLIAVIFTLLVHLFNMQITTLKRFQVQEKELKETRYALTESKVYEEIHSLVHDLKTPLVSVRGLISLIEMKYEKSKDKKLKDYLTRVDHSIEKMNEMISEILYENTKKEIHVDEFLRYVISHLTLDDQKIRLEMEVQEDLPCIHVNKIRFARAIANLLENAIISFEGKAGFIQINVKQVNDTIRFQIKDNGPGIKEELMQEIWKEGFSTKDSSGIGLSFVKRVVENHHGTIFVTSTPGSHTQMDIYLPVSSEQGGAHYDIDYR